MLERLLNPVQNLERGLDAVSLNGEAIASNIANADTVGYQAKSVDFAQVFQNAIAGDGVNSSNTAKTQTYKSWLENSDDSFRLPSVQSHTGGAAAPNMDFEVSSEPSGKIRLDGNNVDIDQQMTELAKNQVTYEALTYAVSKELGRISQVLRDDR